MPTPKVDGHWYGYRPSERTRQRIRERDQGICQGCGAPGTDVAHIIPWPEGNHADANLRLLCASCNLRERRRWGKGREGDPPPSHVQSIG